jgi:hypothetical protein
MRFPWFVCLLLASLAYGQVTPAKPPAAAEPKTEQAPSAMEQEKTVAPNDTVLTVKGVCADSSKQGDDCRTAITRSQFEKLADALQPRMSPAIRRQLANAYSRMLLMSAAAEKRGLDKKPKFDEMLQFARMQILSLELSRTLQEEANKITDQEMEEYYRKNAANFEQADLLRLYIPRAKQLVNPKPDMKEEEREAEVKAGEEEMAKLAADLHGRAAKGEDFDKLQKEAFSAAGFKGTAPETKMNKVRRTTLPPKQVVAMDLGAGEVSELISDPGGYYVYKMISKQNMPLDSVKEEIRGTLSAQRYREAMQAFQKADNVELNDAYFGASPKPPVSIGPRGSKISGEEEDDRN